MFLLKIIIGFILILGFYTMKILYILHSCVMGGATISFINLVEGVALKNVQSVIVYPKSEKKDEKLINYFNSLGCKSVGLDVAVSYNRKGKNKLVYAVRPLVIFIKKVRFYIQLNIVCRKERPDIIHTNTGVVHEGWFVAKKMKIPHVWHLREYQTLDFGWKILPSMKRFKEYLNQSYTICITKNIQNYFDLQNSIKSFVVYNPIFKLSEVLNHEKFQKVFLVANRISPEKGIEDILEAFAIFSIQYPDYLLKIAGFGNVDYIGKLKEKCKRLKIDKNVLFLGYTDNIKALMLNSKALIVGSYNEGFGRMTAEANMLGLPVIGRNTAGTSEILSQTNGGWLFNSITEFVDEMFCCARMTDSEIRLFMKKPSEIALDKFSVEQHVRCVMDIYDLLNQK